MSKQQRFGLVAVAIAAVVVAFVVARPDDDDSDKPAASTTPAQTTTAPADDAPVPKPEVTSIDVRGGKPAGDVAEITLHKGDTIRVDVRSDTPQEIHLHGYDVIREAGPGAPARFRVPADIEGVFEMELEEPGIQIAELKVEP